MKLRYLVSPGDPYPRGYGRAWDVDFGRASVCYPIPLNWLARWILLAWLRLTRGGHGWMERELGAAYRRGREDAAFMEETRRAYLERSLADAELVSRRLAQMLNAERAE